MPLSSYLGSNRRGGGWTQALLPSSSSVTVKSPPKAHQPRKPRKRTALLNFLFTNFFTIALSVSLLFFLLTLFLFGIPKPISSHFKPRSLSRRLSSRRPVTRKKLGSNPYQNGAAVDITTKQLYDKIEFLNKPGGAWTQGWKVSYKGDEWDSEKLKVVVVPHSHNDPGWKFTVEEYYEKQTRHILDTIVETLSKVIFLPLLGFLAV